MWARGLRAELIKTYEGWNMPIAGSDDAALVAFLQERNAALRSLDLAWARKQADAASDRTGAPRCSDEGLLGAIHNARLLCKDIEPELRHESAAWLREHMPSVYARSMAGVPEGILPE
jgi:hypothetical protein